MTSSTFSRLTVGTLLVLLPVFAYIEHTDNQTWNSRLAIPFLIKEPNRHTPKVTDGTYLPPVITENRTYTLADSPLLISGQTVISANTSVKIEEGVTIFVLEYGQILNEGTLSIEGTSASPVSITTNEANTVNQTWGGIVSKQGSTTIITETNIEYASPGVTCLPNSTVMITNSTISRGNVGIFAQSPKCRIQDSTITGVRDGIIAKEYNPIVTNVSINASKESQRFISVQ